MSRAGGVRRALLRGVAAVLFLVLAGATYQGVTTALERRQLPHPGRLVRAIDHQLHIYCTGEGRPTIVLDAPATGMSAAWGWVQQDLQQRTRVCSYDRSGLGWSEWGPRPYDPARVPEELHALLQASREPAPYVMVGHGLGAAFARLFASRFPSDTAALVLIDSPSDSQNDDVIRLVAASPWLARAGLLRATRTLARRADGLPGVSGAAMHAFLNRPDHLTRASRELAQWDRTRDLAATATLPGVPIEELHIAGSDPLALLADRGQAARATSAIRTTLEHLKR